MGVVSALIEFPWLHSSHISYAPVAQQIRAAGFGPVGRGCNSYREHHHILEREPDKRAGIPC